LALEGWVKKQNLLALREQKMPMQACSEHPSSWQVTKGLSGWRTELTN